ncbi:MAG TPA: hypothetical protein V6C65_06840, partial [Allocoleopsis sp.]
MWNPFQPVNRIEQYTPIFSDDNYESDLEQETERDRAWGEDDDFNFDDLLEDTEDQFRVDDDDEDGDLEFDVDADLDPIDRANSWIEQAHS